MIYEIHSFEDPALDLYARKSEAALRHLYEPNGGVFLAESPKVIRRALAAGCEPVSFLMEKKQLEGEAQDILGACPNTPVYTAAEEVLRALTGFPMTRGALCVMKRPQLPEVSELCRSAKRIAILESVVNPTNVGAIFRSAAAMHVDAILLTPGCSDPLSRRSSRVSMGTVFQIPWTYIDQKISPWPGEALIQLKQQGFYTAALALKEDSVTIEDPRLAAKEKLAIILGTEGEGLTDETIAACDDTVLIPMSHDVDSLNVAAASAVAFWELRYRR